MSTHPLLAVENLVVSFPVPMGLTDIATLRRRRVRAVAGVDLIVNRGETLGLVGESGCGKSTLSRAIVGLVPTEAGRVRLDGRDREGMSAPDRKAWHRRVQRVFQEPHASLNPRMTIGQTLGEVFRVHRICPPAEIEARVGDLLEAVGLRRDFANRRPHGLSGGQCQRVGIARALAVEPDLIIADEAVSALDVSIQAQVLNLFMELQRARGVALLFVSHDLTVVRHLCQRVAVMYLGHVVEIGPADAVLHAPLHPYTAALVAAIPQPGKQSLADTALMGEPPSPLNPPSGCPFHPRCARAISICASAMPEPRRIAQTTVWCHHAEDTPALQPERII